MVGSAVRSSGWSSRSVHELVVGVALLILATWPSPAFADSVRDDQWHLAFLGVSQARHYSDGAGVTVAVIDSGVNERHPDLTGNVLRGVDLSKGSGGNSWEDLDGHGTEMAALIAGHGHGRNGLDGVLGLASSAKILPIRVKRGRDDFLSEKDIARAILWAAEHGAQVINVSLYAFSGPALMNAIAYAESRGAVVVAGVGNRSMGHVQESQLSTMPGVIAVSGVGRDGRFAADSVQGPHVVLSAPAVDIVSASAGSVGAYSIGTGTSAATALVSATAALVRSRYPNMDAANVTERLIRTAKDRGATGRDPQYGFGIVNPVGALTADVPTVDRNPLINDSPSPSTRPSASRSEGSAAHKQANSSHIGWLVAVTAVGLIAAVAVLTVPLVARRRRRREADDLARLLQ